MEKVIWEQRTIDQQEKDEENRDGEKKFMKDDDDLSITSISDSNEVSKSGVKQNKKKWSMFKKTKPIKKIHSQKYP